MLKRFALMLSVGIVLLSSSGCSVFMAAAGKREPNLGMITIGAHRAEVELQLGSPRATVAHEGGEYRTDTYEYELGNEPSAGRAVVHGVMDLLTLGLWEVVGTPIEAFKGEKRDMVITYDLDDLVVGINRPPTAVAQGQPVAHKTKPNTAATPERREHIDELLDEMEYGAWEALDVLPEM